MVLGHGIITGYLPETGKTGVGRVPLYNYFLSEAAFLHAGCGSDRVLCHGDCLSGHHIYNASLIYLPFVKDDTVLFLTTFTFHAVRWYCQEIVLTI